MKLPLLLQASPRIDHGPSVMLSKGTWEFESNLVDTEARLLLNSDLLPLHDKQRIGLIDDSRVSIQIVKPGSEPYITIYANKL